MVRTQALAPAIFLALVMIVVASTASANQSSAHELENKPIDRGYGQHDACFGDKYESDDDLKTGNEISIEDVLKLLNTPGT